MNALKDFNYGSLVQMISEHTNGIEPAKMEISKKLISVSPAPWNVTTAYLNKKDEKVKANAICNAKLNIVRKLETVGKMDRQTLTVTINGMATVYTLGKKNEYFANGMALTKVLETLATGKGNKISIQ